MVAFEGAKARDALAGKEVKACVGPPTYADQSEPAREYLKAAPERVLWGSDWPHPTERDRKPNDATLFDLIAEWAPDEALRQRLLVDNPAILYGFPC